MPDVNGFFDQWRKKTDSTFDINQIFELQMYGLLVSRNIITNQSSDELPWFVRLYVSGFTGLDS